MAAAGFPEVRVVAAGGAPAVLASWRVDAARPTALLYGHYDVQPPGRRLDWGGDPFRLRRRGERLVGRGAADDKGYVLAQLDAVRRWGAPPLNLCCLYEGEEEIGSPTLTRLLGRHGDRIRADAALVCDTLAGADGRPTLTRSCRGEITVDLEVQGPPHDLHSGRYGGAVTDPAQVLTEIVASLHDRRGRVTLRGFYEDVRPERAPPAAGVLAASALRPAVMVTRLVSGTPGTGAHHVIPASASGQLNVRLVAGQDPGRVYRSLVRHVRRWSPPQVETSTKILLAVRPWLGDPAHPLARAAAAAVRETTGRPPAIVRSGGTIPALVRLEDAGTVGTSVLLGFGGAGDAAHGPEESTSLASLELAADTVARALARSAAGGAT